MASLAAIKEIEVQFSNFYNAGDAEGAANMYSEDGILIPPNVAMIKGRAAIAGFFKDFIKAGAVKMTVEVQDAYNIDDQNTVELSLFSFHTADDQLYCKGRWMTYWKKINGSWLCKLDTLSPMQ